MIDGNPIAKLLMYANSAGRISYEVMMLWADEFGITGAEMIDLYEAVHEHESYCSCTSAFAPSPRSDRPRDTLFDFVANAYAERWIGLDRVLSWAEERELEDDEVMTLLERCASEGHTSEPRLA